MDNSKSLPSLTGQIAENQEEIIIMSSVNEMVKHFVKENAIIWYDPNVHSAENAGWITQLKNICDIQVFMDWKDALKNLKKETELSCCQVITSETNGELFVKEISNLPLISSIYVFCESADSDKAWTSQYSKIVCVENKFESLFDNIRKKIIRWQRTSSSLRVNLPSFAPIFDEIDVSEMNYLQLYLQGLINFTNRSQAKKDFLDLARALYGKNKYIEDFEKNYNQYDMTTILNWYTKECFLYRLTNNCLRIAKSDSIQYCRLVLKDLETAIKDKYQQQSHKFTGLLYRGAYLSDDEWRRIQQNINRDIEMHGFLSTTKSKDIAIGFCQEDMDKKAMITIVVPNFPDKGVQGFAEMSEYTDFPSEEEVLFNVRSRFTVLEAAVEEIDGMKIRHLVLLYGAQAMRRYTTQNNPSIEVEINCNTENMECKVCNQKSNIDMESVIAVNICSPHEYLCQDCMKQPHIIRRFVLLYVSPSTHGLLSSSVEKNMTKTINMKIGGTVMRYQDSLNIPFYGDKCAICTGTRFNSCSQCLDCKETKMIYCDNCFHDLRMNDCLRKGHIMIFQGYPFSFWSDKMSKIEENHYNYHKEKLDKNTNGLFIQGKIYYETHNYEKAIEYFQKYLKLNNDSKNEEAAVSYNNLGSAYKHLGEYQKAIEHFSKSLEIKKAMLEDNHPSIGSSYNDLGSVYQSLGEYQRAIEYYSKSLEIDKAVFGENHRSTATSYSNLGLAYDHLGESQKALEYYYKSLEIRKVLFGDNHPETALSYINLGSKYDSLGEYNKAIEYSSKSLAIMKAVFGDNHPETAVSYNNLGSAYDSLGEYKKALGYYSKSLEIRKAVLGDNHPSTAISYNNLGNVCGSLGEYQKAIEYNSKSLEINKAVFGDNHPNTGTSYSNLGLAYKSSRDYQKAIEYYLKSLEIRKTVFGDNHPETAISYNNLGSAYESSGEYEKAIEYYFKSLEIRKIVFGDNHPETASSYNNLGSAYQSLRDYQKALDFYSKSLEIRKAVFGENHCSMATSYNNLGEAYYNLGESQKAIEYYYKSLEIRKAVFGDNHSSTATSYNNLGEAYDDLGESQKALEYYSKSLEIRKTVFGDNHSDTVASYHNLGSVYEDLGEYQKAIECLSKSMDIYRALLGEKHPYTVACENMLESLKQKLK